MQRLRIAKTNHKTKNEAGGLILHDMTYKTMVILFYGQMHQRDKTESKSDPHIYNHLLYLKCHLAVQQRKMVSITAPG